MTTTGCNLLPSQEAQAQSDASAQGERGAAAVETAIAETGTLSDPIEYTGTTGPVRRVSLRSQVEGRLLNLNADVGDPVSQGQPLAQLDNRLLTAALNQSEAELAALRSEVVQAEAEVSDAESRVAQAQAELQQAQIEADRLQGLAAEGVISQQEAERGRTVAITAEQAVRSAQEQVRTRQQAVVAARGRVEAQRAVVAEELERRQFSSLTAPIDGVVLERVTEPGNLVQPGDEVLSLGDFSAIKVIVQVSELELATIQTGQAVQVRLDAFPNQTFEGRVSRISPAADPTARLVPVEITMPNPTGQVGSGLLARVTFQSMQAQPIIVPESALTTAEEEKASTLFVVETQDGAATVLARSVQIGDRANGQVEVRAGLQPGETYVVRSSAPLEDGQSVRLSILSETAPQ
ncbi:efflux RND transporter periplasmic adaptor subunit [Thermocoleostomius sinensis]|uniref:Efflux RND transporter periplasmic adaptor subunit n=1 Tax=Thermocoleostomius sinensis A174 TaxID=2016057 RepID=A0A9E9C302_9CYAN|nr:efflux RND transporter periplasmic adaptor subunit [Thermocoleostomius sinensis]WAL58441.1 efflux RND transporter periplasmic adaptor subunit [Thermocoleostomius sinensis A174]